MKEKINLLDNLSGIALSLFPVVDHYLSLNIITNVIYWSAAVIVMIIGQKRFAHPKTEDIRELNLNNWLFRFSITGYALLICYLLKHHDYAIFWYIVLVLEIALLVKQIYKYRKYNATD